MVFRIEKSVSSVFIENIHFVKIFHKIKPIGISKDIAVFSNTAKYLCKFLHTNELQSTTTKSWQ